MNTPIPLHASNQPRQAILFFLLLMLGNLTAQAQNNWTGNTNRDWNTASNWSAGIPTATSDVVIPSAPANQPVLSTTATAKSVEVQAGASLSISNSGRLTLNGSKPIGVLNFTCTFLNDGSVNNSGQVVIGNSPSASVGDFGIRNNGTFANNTGSSIAIDRTTSTGLFNVNGSFTNSATITIGAVASVGEQGILNQATFANNTGGSITIDQISLTGLINNRSFTNSAQITIRAGRTGILNGATNSTFQNTGCTALINIVADAYILNIGTFSNGGTIIENATGNSSISSNAGLVQNLNGGTFTIGTNTGVLTTTPGAQPTIAASPSLTITQGQSATLTASGAIGYSWSTGETTPAITVSATGPYSVTGTTGGCSSKATVGMTVVPTFTVSNPAICPGQFVNLGNYVSNKSPITGELTYYTSQANAQAGTNALISGLVGPVNVPVTYYVRYDAAGSFSIQPIMVTLKPALPAPPVLTQNGHAYTDGVASVTVAQNSESVILAVPGCDGTVSWSGPNNFISFNSTISVPTSTTGSFTYSASCSSETACFSGSSQATVTVNVVVPVCGSVVYVTPGGAGSQNGSSWTNAFSGTALQTAINTAAGCGAQVWVASGLYKPTLGADRTISFAMKNGVVMYGGFVGTETSLSGRILTYPSSTTLSGDLGTVGDNTDNSYNVINNPPGLTLTAVLDGFLITGGNANLNGTFPYYYGGGILNNKCSPTIRNCTFQNNSGFRGGAVCNYALGGGSSNPTFINCAFVANSASSGGGAIWNAGNNNGGSVSPQLVNCSFVNNAAGGLGGGAIVNDGCCGGNVSLQLTNCSFLNNSAGNGGAIWSQGAAGGSASTQLTNCVFFNNGSSTLYNDVATVTASYSLFDNTVTGYNTGGTGNQTITVSPFASTTSTNLRTGSPAIDSGNPTTTTATVGATDLVGNPRIVGGRIDMGAYEFQGNASLTLVASASPNPVCVGNSATLSITVSGGTSPYSYTWAAPAGATLLATNTAAVSATLTVAGVQTFTVSVAGAGGPVTSTTVSVTANAIPTAGIVATPSLTVCQGASVTLTASAGNPGTTYQWNNGQTTQAIVINTNDPSGNPGPGGGYSGPQGPQSLTVTNAAGCSAITTVTLTINPVPTASITPSSQTVCQGQPASLTASGGSIYQWNTGETTAVISVTATGTYSVTVSGTTGPTGATGVTGPGGRVAAVEGCYATAFAMVTVNPAPIVTIAATPSLTVTQGQSTTLTAAGADSYRWSLGQNTAAISVSVAGPYSVTGTTGSCSATATVTVSVTAVTYPCGSIVYVTQAGAGLQNGSSWGNAFAGTALQAAINTAAGCSAQVWVAQGKYKPTGTTGPDSRTISFSMANGVAMYGGLTGTEPAGYDMASRDLNANKTTLSGDIDGVADLVTGSGSTLSITGNDGNAYHVISNNNNGLTSSAILDGFTISGGNASLLGTDANNGGGMYNSLVSPTIRNCMFYANSAVFSGGAMYNTSSTINLTNCRFLNNKADAGGAIQTQARLSGVTVNHTLLNCSFTGNAGTTAAGAINHGFGNSQGQGVFDCTNCTFTNNYAFNGSDLGSAGAFFNEAVGFDARFTNCLFDGNKGLGTQADEGGGALLVYSGTVTVLNSTFVNNGAATKGGAIRIYQGQGTVNVKNSVFRSNTAPIDADISTEAGGVFTIQNSLLQVAACPPNVTCGPGMLYSQDPLFINPGADNYQLTACSPAIDAGDPATTSATVGNTDLAGNSRFYTGGPVDMGAYEFQGTANQPIGITSQPVAGSMACAGSTVTATVSVSGTAGTPGGLYTYQWYKDGSAVGNQTSAMLSLTNVQTSDAGSYSLVATGACNSVTSTAFSLTINPAVTATITGTLTVITGGTTMLTASDAASSSGTSFTWSTGQTTAGISVTAGVYSVTVANASGCTGTANATVVTVNSPPVAVANANQNAMLGVYFTYTVNAFTDIDTPNSLTYSATIVPANGLTFDPNTRILSGFPTQSGAATVTITATDPGGLSASTSFTITVEAVRLTVLSRDPENGNLNTNTIRPYLLLQNDGSTPIPYGELTLRYYLTLENPAPLHYDVNYAQMGNDKVHFTYVPLSPARQGATGYIEFSFDASAGGLGAGTNAVIQDLINKQDYSMFFQGDDYSYVNNLNFAPNSHITAYRNGVLVYGTEPGPAGPPPANTPPMPTANPSQMATVGVSYSYQTNAFSDTETPNSLTYTVSISPANGFTFNPATRVIQGTPQNTGVSSVTITATDPGGLSASTTFTINVLPQPVVTPLALTLTANPTAILTTGMTTLSATVSGGTSPYGYAFSGPGTIQVSGNTATVQGLSAGVKTFTVTVTDATSPVSQTIATTVSVTVTAPPNQPPVASANNNQTATVGVNFTYTANAFSDETPNSLIYTASFNPANNLTFNPATRMIQGIPGNTGVTSVTITATDPGSLSASTIFTITVSAAPVVGATQLTVLSRDPDNGQLNTNTLKPYLQLQNDGGTGIPYSEITVRYWLTVENPVPLRFDINYAQMGNNNVHLTYVPISPARQGATGYIEFSFDAAAGSLGAGSNAVIQDLVNKQDYSYFNQGDDYSYRNTGNFTANARITAYRNGVLIYGTEPPTGTRLSAENADTPLMVRVLGNPLSGGEMTVDVQGAAGQPLRLRVTDLAGYLVSEQAVERAGTQERQRLGVGRAAAGLLFLQVSTPTQSQTVKVLKVD